MKREAMTREREAIESGEGNRCITQIVNHQSLLMLEDFLKSNQSEQI
jgi:hypothetical protein